MFLFFLSSQLISKKCANYSLSTFNCISSPFFGDAFLRQLHSTKDDIIILILSLLNNSFFFVSSSCCILFCRLCNTRFHLTIIKHHFTSNVHRKLAALQSTNIQSTSTMGREMPTTYFFLSDELSLIVRIFFFCVSHHYSSY